MKHTIKLLTLAFTLAAILTLTGCPGPVNTVVPCTHENKKTVIETAATCTETGLEKIICADCGEVLEKQKLPIDPENHDWVLESDTATCTENGEKTYKCSRCDETKTENIPAHHTFIAGGCDKCGVYEHNKEDDYQIMAYVYSSEEDALNDKNERVLYFSFPNNTTGIPQIVIGKNGPEITIDSLIQMKSGYAGKTVKYFSFDSDDFLQDINEKREYPSESIPLTVLENKDSLNMNLPIYIVIE